MSASDPKQTLVVCVRVRAVVLGVARGPSERMQHVADPQRNLHKSRWRLCDRLFSSSGDRAARVKQYAWKNSAAACEEQRSQGKSRVGPVPTLSLPPQCRVHDARQAFPSFERHDPKRTCLPACGPFLPAHDTPELAVCIRLWRAYNVLRAHPGKRLSTQYQTFMKAPPSLLTVPVNVRFEG